MTDLGCFCYAVGHDDEGVCLSLSIGPYQILLDCGLSDLSPLFSVPASHSSPSPQSGSNLNSGSSASASACSIDAVICSHAHVDHSRGLRAFQNRCPHVPIYTSDVTAYLLSVQWLGADRFPETTPVAWRSPLEICPGLMLQLWPAGHLPGAACIFLTYDGTDRRQTVLYTGDCTLSPSRLVDGLPLDELHGLKPDVLIVDGSYGTTRAPRRKEQENQLSDVILRAIAQGQSIILPTSRLGLGQELLMLFRSHYSFTGQDLDIWVSPSIAAGCDAYLDLLAHFPSAVQNFARHQPLFWDDRIRPRVHRFPGSIASLVDEQSFVGDGDPLKPPRPTLGRRSEEGAEALAWVIARQKPSIFLLETSIEFLEQHCQAEQPRWMILLAQHPAQDDYQTFLSQLATSPPLQAQVQAGVLTPFPYSLSCHCDGPALMQLIHSIRPQHLVLVHGPPHFLMDLASQEELQTRYQIHLPTANTRIELPIGDRFIQPEPPVLRYEGELTALQTTVLLTLDAKIQDDARWRTFADTGLIDAQWQGNDLLIRSIPAHDTLRGIAKNPPLAINSCESCLYYRDQRCGNKASSLFGFRVAPQGSCPVFEPA